MRLLLAAALIAFPLQAVQSEKPDVMCNKGWCAIKQDTLKALLNHSQKLQEHNAYIETLCGWRKP